MVKSIVKQNITITETKGLQTTIISNAVFCFKLSIYHTHIIFVQFDLHTHKK